MDGRFRGELRKAFLETGVHLAGALAGGAAAYYLLHAGWVVTASCAVAGAWAAGWLSARWLKNGVGPGQDSR